MSSTVPAGRVGAEQETTENAASGYSIATAS